MTLQFFIVLLMGLHVNSQYVNSDYTEWNNMKSHVVQNTIELTNEDLKTLIMDEWHSLVAKCPRLPYNAKIDATFDPFLEGTNYLAYANQNLQLDTNSVWVSSLYKAMKLRRNFTFGSSPDIILGINPTPPNGWYVGESCVGISYRYDLRTVVRHELLHSIAMATSIRKNETNDWNVGYWFNNNPNFCYPTLYDTVIKDVNNKSIVYGCSVDDVTMSNMFIGNIKLYNPFPYSDGSSLSHHNFPDHLMFHSLPPMKCLNVGHYEATILANLGITCTIGNTTYYASSSSAKLYSVLWILVTVLVSLLL